MRVIRFICSLTFLAVGVVSCSHEQHKESTLKAKSEKISYAKNFEIKTINTIKVLHLLDPENKKIEKKIAFVHNGEKAPEGYIPLVVPIRSMIALSSTHIGMLAKLDKTDIVSGVCGHQYIHDPIVQKNYKKGKVFEMGSDENNIPIENILQSKATLLMYSGFGTNFSHEKQLVKMGTVCLANYDWKEVHPLGKAEWIKVFGILTGKEKEASDYFNQIEKEYKYWQKIAKTSTSYPTLFSGNLVGDVWNSPAGESYNALLFKHAHAKYTYAISKGTGSVQHSFEEILHDNLTTDFWLNPGVSSRKELLAVQPKFVYFKAYKENKIYSYSYSGNEFWERSAIEPQHVLADLIHLLHPEIKNDKPFYFYKKI